LVKRLAHVRIMCGIHGQARLSHLVSLREWYHLS
jgi:hypothetical protein